MTDMTQLILTAHAGNGFDASVLDKHNRPVALIRMWSEGQSNDLAQLFATAPMLLIAAQAAYELILGMPALREGPTAQLLHRALTMARQRLTP